MTDALVFIPLMIVAITQIIKMAVPAVQGWVTLAVAAVVGMIVALLDVHIGVQDITIAQGLMAALTAVGISVVAGKAGGGTPGDPPKPA